VTEFVCRLRHRWSGVSVPLPGDPRPQEDQLPQGGTCLTPSTMSFACSSTTPKRL
jgi:hypothetical protein